MKYVDIPSMLEADVEKAIRERVEDGCGNLYVLVNYTALFSTRNVLKRWRKKDNGYKRYENYDRASVS